MIHKKPLSFSLGFLGIILAGILFPEIVLADLVETELGDFETYSEFISAAWGFSAQVVFGIAVIAIIIGGMVMVSSGGSDDRADLGRQTVRGGIIGITITLFSAVFYNFITNPVAGEEEQDFQNLNSNIQTLAQNLMIVAGGLCALGIVYSGIKYMTSGGDDLKLQSAKKAFNISIIGTIISVSAWGISNFLFGVFGG